MNQQQTILVEGLSVENLLTQIRSIVRAEIETIPKPEKVKDFISISECAQLLGLAKQTVYAMTSAKKIPHIKRGSKLLFNRAEIITWLQQSRQPVEE